MKIIYLFYPKGKILTGQEFASKLIVENLSYSYSFKTSHFPGFNRSSPLIGKILYPLRVFLSWFKILNLLFVTQPKVYVNLGQTHFSLIRDGIPFNFLSFFKPSLSMVISLHGHVFTTWDKAHNPCKLFTSILKKASYITVLGEVQKRKLIELGLEESRIKIVPNTCELSVIESKDNNSPIKILYLSNLIEGKGYKEFLLAIEILSRNTLDEQLEVTLCGAVYDGDIVAKTQEINEIIERANSSKFLKINWVKGAYGDEKSKLFEKADIFIFPSKYKVEAQPIILIEAMASSCAIITTKVGEIPSTVSVDNAISLKNTSPELIAEKTRTLIDDKEILKSMQKASLERFKKVFSLNVYKQNWQQIFDEL